MTNNSYHKQKECLQKEACKIYQNLTKLKKDKRRKKGPRKISKFN